MKARARAVVIGGGVGGCSILYWLTRLGWDDVVLCERADLTSGSTFHSAGLVGQLRSSLALTQMMMSSVDLYRALEAEVGLETGWKEVGSLRLASSPERLEEISRQAGWAKTFGLPLDLISPAEAQELFPPMTTGGVLGAAYLPTDGYIDPSQLTFALAEGARRRGAEIYTSTRVTGVRVVGGRVTAVETDKGEIETEIVVNAGGMYAREIGLLAGVIVPLVPMAHGGLAAVRASAGERAAARALARRHGGDPADQRAGGVHAGRGVHPRPERRARLLGRRGLLRARPRRRRRSGTARCGVDRRGDAVARRLAHGLAPFRRRLPQPRVHARAHDRGLLDLLRRQVPRARAPGGAAAADEPDLRPPAGARRRLRREVRLGARELVRAERCRRGRGPAPARLGGEALVAGDRSRARRLPRDGRALRRDVVREDRGLRRRRSGVSRASLRQPRRRRRRRRDLHADVEPEGRDRVRLHGHAPRRGSLPHRHGHRVRPARSRLDPPARARGRLGARRGRDLEIRLPRPLGAARPRHPAAADDRGPLQRPVPVHACAGCPGWIGPVPGAAGDLRRRAGLGAVLPDRVRPPPLGHALEAGRAHGLVAAGYKAIDSLRLEKGYRVWGADMTPGESPYESGLGFAVRLDKGDFLGRDALVEAGPEPRRRLACLTLADPRSVALGSEPVRVSGAAVGRVTSGGYGYTVGRSIAYAYLPAEHAVPGTPVEVEIFGDWVAGEIAAEPLFDPSGERIRA